MRIWLPKKSCRRDKSLRDSAKKTSFFVHYEGVLRWSKSISKTILAYAHDGSVNLITISSFRKVYWSIGRSVTRIGLLRPYTRTDWNPFIVLLSNHKRSRSWLSSLPPSVAPWAIGRLNPGTGAVTVIVEASKVCTSQSPVGEKRLSFVVQRTEHSVTVFIELLYSQKVGACSQAFVRVRISQSIGWTHLGLSFLDTHWKDYFRMLEAWRSYRLLKTFLWSCGSKLVSLGNISSLNSERWDQNLLGYHSWRIVSTTACEAAYVHPDWVFLLL